MCTLITKETLNIDIDPMLSWIETMKKVRPEGRGTGNPRGAQWSIKPHFRDFLSLTTKICGIAKLKTDKFTIPDIWVNYSPPGCINAKHNHVGADIGGCFYLAVPENSGTIQFETGEEFMPVSGDILFWDANIIHWVNENKSKQDRISIAFNIKYDS